MRRLALRLKKRGREESRRKLEERFSRNLKKNLDAWREESRRRARIALSRNLKTNLDACRREESRRRARLALFQKSQGRIWRADSVSVHQVDGKAVWVLHVRFEELLHVALIDRERLEVLLSQRRVEVGRVHLVSELDQSLRERERRDARERERRERGERERERERERGERESCRHLERRGLDLTHAGPGEVLEERMLLDLVNAASAKSFRGIFNEAMNKGPRRLSRRRIFVPSTGGGGTT